MYVYKHNYKLDLYLVLSSQFAFLILILSKHIRTKMLFIYVYPSQEQTRLNNPPQNNLGLLTKTGNSKMNTINTLVIACVKHKTTCSQINKN